jgi:hypothetical protein
MKRLLRLAAPLAVAAVVSATGVVLLATPAQATADTTIDKQKQEVTRRIDLRLAALTRFTAALGGAERVTAAHRSTLQDLLSADVDGLTALRAKVAGETTTEALRADAASMINDYRIFVLVHPKVKLTIVADNEAAAAGKLQDAHDTLAAVVAKAKAAGKPTGPAETALASMQASIDKATAALDGQVAALLALQPGPDGKALRAQVLAIRQALGGVHKNLRAAHAVGKRLRGLLKAL